MSTGGGTIMDIERLRVVLDAYGGDPRAWPEDERDAALALLARSGEARQLREDALTLDATLDALPAAAPSPDLAERIVTAVLATGPARARRSGASSGTRPALRAAGRRRRPVLRVLAGAVPLAAAAALGVWLYGERTPTGGDVTAPVEISLAGLGVYETPGDALLDVPVVDGVYDGQAWTGCPDAGLGCLELDALPLEPVSRGEEERYLT